MDVEDSTGLTEPVGQWPDREEEVNRYRVRLKRSGRMIRARLQATTSL